MMISSSSSAAVRGSLRIPRSSMMSRGTVTRNSMCSLRVPSSVASASSSRKLWVSVEHAVSLLDGGLSDGLGQVALASAGGTEKQCVFAARDKAGSSQIEDQAAIHLLVESEVEVVEGLL